ncbi:MAG: two-component system response regulator, partial [Deltaproteobacteria bacterium]
MARKKMGEILVENEIISQGDLDQALLRQKGSNQQIGKILEGMDVVLEKDIATALSKQFGFPRVKKISQHRFPQTVLDKIDSKTALEHLIFPLKIDNNTLYLAMSNPLDMALQSDLSFKLAMQISPCVATPDEIKAAIKKHYSADIPVEKKVSSQIILLIDNQDNIVEEALKKEGYTVFVARNGADGLKIASQLHPQLIITNIVMPRMDGVELFSVLQTSGEIDKTPVIALSAITSAEEEYRLLEMGFFDFIAKPIDPTRLLARARRALKYY